MTRHSHTWFYRFSPCNGGDLHYISEQIKDAVLIAWAKGDTSRQIATALDLHRNTVRKIVRAARLRGDPRGFVKTTPTITNRSCVSVLDLWQDQYVVRGIARRLNLHYTQVQAMVRDVIAEIDDAKAQDNPPGKLKKP